MIFCFFPLIVRGVRKEILVGGNFGLREIIERGGNTKWNVLGISVPGVWRDEWPVLRQASWPT